MEKVFKSQMEVGCGTRNSGGRDHPTSRLRPDTEGGVTLSGGLKTRPQKHENGI